ncbi:MAG: hypothetical protein LBL52_01665 [Rickettsiales bacterium]|nr:hypothetical protein [Rickettsiales bacterium]
MESTSVHVGFAPTQARPSSADVWRFRGQSLTLPAGQVPGTGQAVQV